MRKNLKNARTAAGLTLQQIAEKSNKNTHYAHKKIDNAHNVYYNIARTKEEVNEV